MKKGIEKKTNISSGTAEVAEEKLLGSDMRLLWDKSQGEKIGERDRDNEKTNNLDGKLVFAPKIFSSR